MQILDPTKFRNRYRIASARRRLWDYALPGWYFVTICTRDRERCLGQIRDGRMNLSTLGRIVRDEWHRTGRIRPNVTLDAFVVMPNHIHGIIVINEPLFPVETLRRNVSTKMPYVPDLPRNSFMSSISPKQNSLPSIIRTFKHVVAKRINNRFGPNTFAWQPRYHDRIIRNPEELERIRWYIRMNPRAWGRDRNN